MYTNDVAASSLPLNLYLFATYYRYKERTIAIQDITEKVEVIHLRT